MLACEGTVSLPDKIRFVPDLFHATVRASYGRHGGVVG
jgi:hypothetical protein